MFPASTYGGMPSALRWIFWVYFATHIPITILIDAQVRPNSFGRFANLPIQFL